MKPSIKNLAFILLMIVMLLAAGAAQASPAPLNTPNGSPMALLPGDTTPAPAAFNQDTPQMARGGSNTLVVWEDSRTNYNNSFEAAVPQGGYESGQQLKDIYAARLDSTGQLLDTTPIVVAQAPWSQTHPHVAWNGQNWLVVWNTQRVAGTATTIDVLAARVSPSGTVLDNPAIVLKAGDTLDELWPVLASDGTNWLVAWMNQDANGAIGGTRVAPDGTVLDPGGALLHSAVFPDIPFNPSLIFAGDEYLLVWTGNNRILGQRLSPTLQALSSVFQVMPGNFAILATNGIDFLVTAELADSVLAARVTHDGTVLDPNGFDVSGSHGGSPRPQPIWDGTQWVVTWVTTLNTAYAARLNTSGTLLDPNGILVANNARLSAIGERPGGGALLAWTDIHLGGLASLDIFSAAIGTDGQVGQAAAVAMGAPSQIRPDLAGDGTGYLAVFASNVSGETRIKAQRLDANGAALDAEPFLIQGGSATLVRPRVAWNGTVYLVVWEDSSVNRGFVHGAIFGKRVSPGGQILDATPIDIMGGNTPDVAALGSTFLVVDTYEQTNHIRFPMAVRVDGSGAVLGTATSIGQNYAQLPKVAALGSRWLAVWQRSPTHDSPSTFIHAAFVNPDGTGAGSFLVAGLATGNNVTIPDVAAGPAQALISYFNSDPNIGGSGDIFARRILADGTLLDSDPGIQVTTAPQAQFVPAAAWDGSEYIVAYEDYRTVPFLDRPVSDVYATRLDSNGTVLDPNGVPVGNEAVPEVNPVVAANGGSYLIGTANFKDQAPYGAYRINVLYGQAGSPPPSATATPTVPTSTPGPTHTPSVTGTPVPPTATPGGPTSTPPPASSATPSPTVCAVTFADVPAGSTFYTFIRCLACQGIVGGYPCGGPGEPCPGTYYRPNNNVTRGQAAKILASAAGYAESIPSSQQTFNDVASGSTFWLWVERIAAHGAISGYPCGGTGEPCPGTYYRPQNNLTRGQMAKIDATVAGYTDIIPSTRQTFADVAPGSTFWLYTEQIAQHGIIAGYACGGPGEPCPGTYFRPGLDVTRGQTAKIVTNTFFPNCSP